LDPHLELPVTHAATDAQTAAPSADPTARPPTVSGRGTAPATPAAPAAPGSAKPTTVHSTREIEALIPHRWPILLVDRIVEYDAEAKRIVGIKGVAATEWFFQGHFPGLPVMPGVFPVEALPQTIAVYVAKQPGFGDRIGLFAGIDDCRFKRIVVPGDVLRLEITMEKLGSRFGRARGVATVDGEVACEATLSFVIPPEGALR
jgi:3-hydroxyacyl-[acyl-carrier-protein] dehydratase